ncbi:MAG: prephenate dehydrogenase/arogenate dehydrogenase family protein [Thaumarchaeota archaeon]|nr:prephenate dehydrogenase/arogenate dehydrogenase family protein [Nitrososphaerota archaeon]
MAVIGSSGGMGRFFVKYFVSRGDDVTGSDPRAASVGQQGFRLARSNLDAVKGAELVLVATPVDRTVETVEEITPRLSAGACVIEISSVKGKVVGPLKKTLQARKVKLLSLHPLFGPSLSEQKGMKICVVETDKGSLGLARRLFPEANLIPMKEKEHDRTMGLILSLTHVLNIAYAGTVSRYVSAKEFRKLETPTSSVQLTLAEGVLSQSPSLYSYIQLENDFSSEFLGALIGELSSLKRLIDSKDRDGFEKRFSEISRAFVGDSESAIGSVYQAFEKSSS